MARIFFAGKWRYVRLDPEEAARLGYAGHVLMDADEADSLRRQSDAAHWRRVTSDPGYAEWAESERKRMEAQ